jgi:hypothetical protein
MNLLADIESLYSKLPSVACTECGACCVSPTCTLAEFVYLMHHCCAALSENQLRAFVLAAPRASETCDGNLVCQFLKDKLCSVHLWRTGACRLFGIPFLEKLGVANLVSCKHNIRIVSGENSEAFVRSWLDTLSQLNAGLYKFGKAPYHIFGLNLESWLDIYFDGSIEGDVFDDMRRVMKTNVDLALLAPQYVPKTGIKEKIDKISVLSMMLSSGDSASLRELLLSIRDDYPLTGTYFQREAQTFLDTLAGLP